MPQKLAASLAAALDRELPALRAIAEDRAAAKPSREGAWSAKQEMGHLIDSATNNHVRFVRGSLEPEFHGPSYDGDGWVARHGYGELPWAGLVDFWERYNRLLVELVARIPEERLETHCYIGAGGPVTLGFVIEDYIAHMQHHLDHILGREKLTEYPGAALGV
jgi:DinB superfamily